MAIRCLETPRFTNSLLSGDIIIIFVKVFSRDLGSCPAWGHCKENLILRNLCSWPEAISALEDLHFPKTNFNLSRDVFCHF